MPFHGAIVVIKRSGADGSTFPLVNEVSMNSCLKQMIFVRFEDNETTSETMTMFPPAPSCHCQYLVQGSVLENDFWTIPPSSGPPSYQFCTWV